MLRKLAAALRAAIAAVASVMRRLEWIWDGAWRLVLSPLRAVFGQPGVQTVEVPDIELEDQVDAILRHELPAAQADAKLAAVEAQRDHQSEPTVDPDPRDTRKLTSMQRTALKAQEMHEAESRRGEAIRAAMLARDLTGLREEERAALEQLDDHEWNDLLDEEKGFRIARQVDDLVRAYAQRHALHARLEREGGLDTYPQPAQGALAFGM